MWCNRGCGEIEICSGNQKGCNVMLFVGTNGNQRKLTGTSRETTKVFICLHSTIPPLAGNLSCCIMTCNLLMRWRAFYWIPCHIFNKADSIEQSHVHGTSARRGLSLASNIATPSQTRAGLNHLLEHCLQGKVATAGNNDLSYHFSQTHHHSPP